MDEFLSPEMARSIVFECFTTKEDESTAAYLIDHIVPSENNPVSYVKEKIKVVLPERVKNAVKELIK